MTYDSFVSTQEEIEDYLGGELKEENTIDKEKLISQNILRNLAQRQP